MVEIEILKSNVGDNFFYLIADGGEAALVDPVDGEQAVEVVRRRGETLKYVLNTHFHPDHVAGNPTVLAAFEEAQVVCGTGDTDLVDAQFVPKGNRGVDRRVTGGGQLALGEIALEVVETPGHTAGHISYRVGEELFSGDTIFTAGAGNCRFGGDPAVLFRTFRDVLRELPEETRFYPGHDYAVRNAEFILSIEPEQKLAVTVLEEAKKAAATGELFQSTLGRERRYNPFLRYDDPKLLARLREAHGDRLKEAQGVSDDDDEAVFRCLRALRNEW